MIRDARDDAPTRRSAWRFILLVGVTNLFADMTYEGARGVTGDFLGKLGASGAIVGLVAGGGELAGYAVRSVSGIIADRTGRHWIDVWAGYIINMLCVPALALAGTWPVAAGLMIGERLGRGIRRPAMSSILSRAGRDIGSGRVLVERLSEAARLSFIDLARFCCASFIVLARPRPPAPQSFDTRLPSTASRVPYCRKLASARGLYKAPCG